MLFVCVHIHHSHLQSIVTNNIVLGSKRDAANKILMEKLGITHILNMAQQVPNHHPNDFIYHKISILGEYFCGKHCSTLSMFVHTCSFACLFLCECMFKLLGAYFGNYV